jgi:hypothetical protein
MQDLSFQHWRIRVDEELVARCGLPGDALPDVDYWGLYLTGDTPEQAAEYVIQNAKEY